jgi:sulfate transport system ATP-binding protein
MAFVRPGDLAVTPYAAGAHGLPARLDRALVVGPMARLELTPRDQPGQILEAHLPADEYRRLGVKEGDSVRVSSRKARVFLDVADDPATMI